MKASENPASIRGIVLKNNIENDLTISRKKSKFKVGDHVRIFRWKSHFEKGFTAKWTQEIFIVRKVNNTVPVTYELEDGGGDEIVFMIMNSNTQNINKISYDNIKRWSLYETLKSINTIYQSKPSTVRVSLILLKV